MMRTGMRMLLTIMLATACMTACTDKTSPSYTHFEEIPANGWNPLDVLVFTPEPYDSTTPADTRYDISLVARYATRHKINALPLAVTVEDNSGMLHADTIILQPEDGDRPTKTVTRYGVCEVRLPLYDNQLLTEGYTLSIESFSPKERSRGLLNVGIVMERE